ncbi:MAG: hypothetical protein NZ899_10590 [Thermoguttaceae bacterium]|nr:hypothetical protein [Thermoguttaceae bacterium]MDW8078916.1 hypothetical protein [Thermoguttaceae bacterium]
MDWSPEYLQALKQTFLGKKVEVVPGRPEYARFRGRIGQVKGVNYNGRVLVQFQGEDRAWYDLPPDALRVVSPTPTPNDEGSD